MNMNSLLQWHQMELLWNVRQWVWIITKTSAKEKRGVRKCTCPSAT